MNERIKELAKQAFNQVWDLDSTTIGPGTHFVPDGFEQKFAELIVEECMTKVSEWDMGIDDPVGATDNTSEVARDIVAEIKKHFGV